MSNFGFVANERAAWPAPATLLTEEAILAVRAKLPKLRAGDPRQAYKWALSMRLRSIRSKAAGPLDAKAVRSLFDRAGATCPECSCSMWHGDVRRPSLDHRVALSRGGSNAIENLRVICNQCNSRKADRV